MTETLLTGATAATADSGPEVTPLGEGRMVREDCWREVHRLFHAERRAEGADAPPVPLACKKGGGPFRGRAGGPHPAAPGPGPPAPRRPRGPRPPAPPGRGP